MRPTFSLLAISDRRSLAPLSLDFTSWLGALGAAGLGGITGVQIREKDLEDGALYELTRRARETLPPGTLLLVNGRLDVALAAGADGAHLPADGLPAAPLRARFGPNVLLGRSTHSLEEVERAREEGVDYVVFGPVYPTPGKGEPVGLEKLAEAARLEIPVYALGGVTLPRFGELAAAGASGAAAIRLFQIRGNLEQVAAAAREHFCRK
ncbi:MAG TPA: thiamine phosphate synthase [Thermoanaerobaculia bacterium]|nr:thiamine phosphate synthase [Thermoanaerobaculia bacterium]